MGFNTERQSFRRETKTEDRWAGINTIYYSLCVYMSGDYVEAYRAQA